MSNKRIDLTYFEGITENRGAMNYEIDENGMVGNVLGIEMNQKDAAAIYNIPKLIAELKRCYDLIDVMHGNVPYVEHCEDCGATDGGEAEGCDYCGIIHYQSKKRGFYHKDSQKASE